jgi:hypothetical protein
MIQLFLLGKNKRKVCENEEERIFLQHKFDANHNKDYSVVKTFRAGCNYAPRFVFGMGWRASDFLCNCDCLRGDYTPFKCCLNEWLCR